METNYASNSHKSKENQTIEAKVKAVVTDGVKVATVKKKTGIQKAAELFLADDISKLKTWVLDDVLIPNAKRIVMETVSTVLFGNKGGASRQEYSGPKVSYGNYFGGKDTSKQQNKPTVRTTGSGFDYGELIFSSYGKAEIVLDELRDVLEQYPAVSVADMYKAAGISNYPFTYQNYGWMNLKDAKVVQISGEEWALRMPKAMPLD